MGHQDRGNGAPRERPVFAREDLLERLGQDELLLQQVLTVFAGDAPVQLESLLRATAAADFEAVRQLAHRLKGAAANVGAVVLARAARALEVAASGDNLEEIPRLAANVVHETDRFLASTKDQLKQ